MTPTYYRWYRSADIRGRVMWTLADTRCRHHGITAMVLSRPSHNTRNYRAEAWWLTGTRTVHFGNTFTARIWCEQWLSQQPSPPRIVA